MALEPNFSVDEPSMNGMGGLGKLWIFGASKSATTKDTMAVDENIVRARLVF